MLEIAIAVAKDGDPFTIERRYTAVLDCVSDPRTWDPFVLDMHSKNGLLLESTKQREDSRKRNVSRLEEVCQTVLRHIPKRVVDGKEKLWTLAGNSVHFDLNFLKVHMPTLAQRFSHRLLDVTAAKLFCASLGFTEPQTDPAHRAEADIDSSMAHMAKLQKFVREYHLTQRIAADAFVLPLPEVPQAPSCAGVGLHASFSRGDSC